MSQESRHEDLSNAFKAEMQQYVEGGFRPADCFPFVFQNLIETTGIPAKDRAELRQELLEWTRKTM